MSFGLIAGGVASALGAGAATSAIVGGVATAAGGYMNSRSAGKAAQSAAQTSANAQTAAGDQIYKQFKETEARLAPYSDAGLPAFEKQQALSGALGVEAQEGAYNDYRESPGVAFMRDRGLRGIDRNAAAQGSLVGGNRDKARIEFAQGMAEQDFNNYFNRLGSVTGTGLAATQAIAGVGSSAAQGQAQMTQAAGASMAGGISDKSQAYQSGFDSIAKGAGSAWDAWRNRTGG